MPFFSALRSWRAEQAKREGILATVICTNSQLAQMAATHPRSLSGLGTITGNSKVNLMRYGQDLLVLLASPPDAKTDSSTVPAGVETTDLGLHLAGPA